MRVSKRNTRPERLIAVSVALAAGVGAVSPVIAQAPGPARKPGQAGGGRVAASPAGALTEEVGSIGGTKVTWGQLIDHMRTEAPEQFANAIAAAVGKKSDRIFSPASGGSITLSKADLLASMRKEPSPFLGQHLSSMLNEMALRQEATRAGILPTPQKINVGVQKMLDDARKNKIIPEGVTDDQFLKQRGISRKQLQTQVRLRLMASGMVEKNLEKELGHAPGPEDILRLRRIMMRVPMRPGAKEEDRAKAEKETQEKITRLKEEIQSGAKTFEAAAKESSQDFATRQKGGDLGEIVRGQMSKEFDKVAFDLKPGEVSSPQKIDNSYQILEVVKLGKDMTPAERQAAIDKFTSDSRRVSQYMNELLTNKVKIVNKLQPAQPATRPSLRPMPPGARPPGSPAPMPPRSPGGEKPGDSDKKPADADKKGM